MSDTHLPRIIQGGMGVAVSSWHLARTVSHTPCAPPPNFPAHEPARVLTKVASLASARNPAGDTRPPSSANSRSFRSTP